MCSILLTNKMISNLAWVNEILQHRGPDATNLLQIQGLTFVHNLLSISGALTTQPFLNQDVIAMYNGEIYNADVSLPSDGYMLIPTYKQHGDTFTQHLDGEFAVVLVDLHAHKLLISTDVFKTKPLFWAQDGDQFGVCTYRTPLERLGFTNIRKMPANMIWRYDIQLHKLHEVGPVHGWDLHQHKTDFTDWRVAFKNSIRKRAANTRKRIFIGLSSGYDSGAIACELTQQQIAFTPFTVWGKEDYAILQARSTPNHVHIHPDAHTLQQAHEWIMHCTEPFQYTICSSSSDYNEFWLDLRQDSGANGLSMVCSQAVKRGCKIYMSGQGADELFSDYGFQGHKIYSHSNFGGLWPADLSTMFPWNSFYGSSMESYLAKEEYVAGSYGIEARYPFLDTQVVQEFLWLVPELKNATYKSVLHDYLTTNAYPFVPNQKIGF